MMSPKRPALPLPDDVQQALEAGEALAAFEARPPKQRDGYVGWIVESRREVTRRKRIRQMLEELYKGNVYMGASWGESCSRPKRY